jgi:pyruvate dehydrogenase E1 component alpha subunit
VTGPASTARIAPSGEELRFLLHQMLRIRRLEEKSAELYATGRIRGFLHLYVGEEAVATGVIPLLEPHDSIVATYREHGHALLRGVTAAAIFAEMYGKIEGCSRGRGGSMHLFDAARRFFGGNAIVGGGLPLAVGLALADRLLGRPGVTACFFGEGAVAEGAFHESLNLAALWRLAVLFVCENNLYAMGTRLDASQSQPDLVRKAQAYAVTAEAADGMDVVAVRAAAARALGALRSGGGPWFLELRTYRYRAHSMFDPELYRSKSEVQAWRGRDPIATCEARLRAIDGSAADERARLDAEVAKEIDAAVAFAEAGTLEPVSDLERHVYAEGGDA